jgi:hypothetical protein
MKALVKVWFKSEEEGGRQNPPKSGVDGGFYSPHIVIHGGNGEMLGIYFSERVDFEFGKVEFTEIRSQYPEVDYSQIVKDARFTIIEGPKVVGEGRVMAVSV